MGRLLSVSGFITLMLLGGWYEASAAPPSPPNVDVFIDGSEPDETSSTKSPEVIRHRRARVRFDRLPAFSRDSGTRFSLNLFDDAKFAAVPTRIEERANQRVITGTLPGIEGSHFTLVIVANEVLVGNIYAPPHGSFQIRHVGNGAHLLRQIDESGFLPCGTTPADGPLPVAGPPPAEVAAGGCADDGSFIDLLVVYTETARHAQGGTAAMAALITLSETETNQAYANSQISPTRVRVVGTHEVDYEESGNSATDRARLSEPSDGFMDEIHPLRDRLSADVVTLLVDSFEVCGRAYFSITAGNVPHEEFGFNVVMASCSAGNYTFGHELGHNQGCRHDRGSDNSNEGAFLYSHGYIHPGGLFRDVMGVQTFGIPRIQYFSNPDVLFAGFPTGVPINDPQSAHNALTINNTAFNVANFRRERDCNNNGLCDEDEIAGGLEQDCNGNGRLDRCEEDCNENGSPDDCDISQGTSSDCNANQLPDECESDCNGNGVPDACDITQGASDDCTGNGVPDDCETDCNANGVADSCDVAANTSPDVNGNQRPDECEPPILHVDAEAAGSNSGTSWANAMTELAYALQVAAESDGFVREVWVVAGAYKPIAPDGERTVSFVLSDGVGVYGGFAGGETSRDQRNPATNVTILSGDLAGNDAPGFVNYEENSFHVLSAAGVGPTAVLDGFTVTAGAARGAYPHNSGGGLLVNTASPTIGNCIFTRNTAFTAGAAVNFRDASTARIDRCIFEGNWAETEGGAVGTFFGASPVISNSLFRGNTANFGGVFYFSHDTRPELINCTVLESIGHISASAYAVNGARPVVRSCIFRGNTLPLFYLENAETLLTVEYNDIPGGAAAFEIADGATLVWGPGNIDVDPLFSADGWHLSSASLCIAKGAPSGESGELDIDGQPRVQHCRVDMGADETIIADGDCNDNGVADACDLDEGSEDVNANLVPDECEPRETIYVNASVCPGTGLGTLTNPFCRIQSALDAAGTGANSIITILVADGVYSGTGNRDLDLRGKALTLKSANGPENCVVDAAGLGRGFYVHSGENQGAVVDGFTVRNGSANNGGGIHIRDAGPIVRNCTFQDNAALLGGGVFVQSLVRLASPQIQDCTILDNRAGNGGGVYATGSSALLTGCTISGNRADAAGGATGGGIQIDGNNLIDDCLLENNLARASNNGLGSGGGIHLGDGDTVISNCVIRNNTAGSQIGPSAASDFGGGIWVSSTTTATPTIENCSITGNTSGKGGGIHCADCAATIRNCTIRQNTANASNMGEGGGVWMTGNEGTLLDCLIEENRAAATNNGSGSGGGVFLGTGVPLLQGCDIRNNTAGSSSACAGVCDRRGGGVTVDITGPIFFGSRPTIRQCRITGNASRHGAGVYVNAAAPTLSDCLIENNIAQFHSNNQGGGIYALNAIDMRVRNCTIRRNTAAEGGGAYNINGSMIFEQCLIAGNQATLSGGWGGGGVLTHAVGGPYLLSLTNCVLFGNSTPLAGAGVRVRVDPGVNHQFRMTNSILWQNTAGSTVEANQLSLSCFSACDNQIRHNCIEGWTGALGGVNNFGADPAFVDPDGPDNIPDTDDDDFHVHAGSPVIDAGDNTAFPADLFVDLGGSPRFVDDPSVTNSGVGPPPIIDFGVYEGGVDCNQNGVADPQDITDGTSEDCSGNGFPDECEPDCNTSGAADSCDILNETSPDCNENLAPDECDLSTGASADCNGNVIPDECEPDADSDGTINACDGCPLDANKLAPGLCGCGISDADSDADTVPNCHDACPGFNDFIDSDGDTTPNGCDVCFDSDDRIDSDDDGTPDGCDLCPGFDDRVDGDEDFVPDSCDQCPGFDDRLDCNENQTADGCDIGSGFSLDFDANGLPDECDAPLASAAGARYLTWTPHPGPHPTALSVRSVQLPCLDHFVDFDLNPQLAEDGIARLVPQPVYRLPMEWGTLRIRSSLITSFTSFDCHAQTLIAGLGTVSSSVRSVITRRRGDVDGNGSANFTDIALVVDRYRGLPGALPLAATDLWPCTPDADVDFGDIAADVEAFRGVSDSCSNPCGLSGR